MMLDIESDNMDMVRGSLARGHKCWDHLRIKVDQACSARRRKKKPMHV